MKIEKKLRKILIIFLIILLILSNGYFILKSQKLDYDILIGIPVKSKTNNTIAVDFSKSQPLEKKREMNIVIFSFMNADSVEVDESVEDLPDAIIWVSDPEEKITYYRACIWLDDNAVIFKIEDESSSEYKKIDNTYYASELKHIINNHIDLYQ